MPHCHDGHDLTLPPDSTLEAAHKSALTHSSEPTAQIEDEWLDTALGAATSTAMEPNTVPVLCKAHNSKVPDSSPDSGPSMPLPIESGWAPVMEFTAVDIFQHSPFGDVLDSLRSLSLSVRRLLAELCPARVGSWRRRNSLPTHHPLNSHGR